MEPIFLSKDQIIALDDRVFENIWVERWGTFVRMKGLTAAQRDRYEASLVKESGQGKKKVTSWQLENARARLVSLCLCDESGNRMFNDNEVQILSNKAADAIEPLFDAARRLSGMTEEDVEELLGNSETSQDEGSPSD